MARVRGADDPRVQRVQECRRLILQILRASEVEDTLENPQIPEVLVNPDFLIVPRIGKLLTIDIQSLKEGRTLWDFALAKIEDLFEIKMSAGGQTVVSLILFQWDGSERSHDAITLLERLFDRVLIISPNNNLNEVVSRFVHGLIRNPISRENLDYLWQLENEARQSNFEKIANLSFVKNVLHAHEEFEAKPPGLQRRVPQKDLFVVERAEDQIERAIFDRLLAEPSFWVQNEPRVMNMKQFLINSLTQYYFTFDFAFSPVDIDHQYGNFYNQFDLDRLFERQGGFGYIVRGSKGSFGKISLLRRLATYARFISYIPDESGRILRRRDALPRLFLLMDGNIFGPRYAPDRYLNMLIHAGWRPINVDDLSKEALLEGG